MSKDRTFADGFIFKRHKDTPEWVVGNMSIKVEEAITFLTTYNKNGWVNVGIKTSKEGKYYVELDTFEPKPKDEQTEQDVPTAPAPAPKPAPAPEPASEEDEDLPF